MFYDYRCQSPLYCFFFLYFPNIFHFIFVFVIKLPSVIGDRWSRDTHSIWLKYFGILHRIESNFATKSLLWLCECILYNIYCKCIIASFWSQSKMRMYNDGIINISALHFLNHICSVSRFALAFCFFYYAMQKDSSNFLSMQWPLY